MKYRSDDYTRRDASDDDSVYHGTSPETGSVQKTITPNGEIADEAELAIGSRTTTTDGSLDDDGLLVAGTEADVTAEDLQALGSPDLSMDMGDDEDLKHRVYPVDFAGEDLDIPGSELDDDQEALGSEDEENNCYSLGEN
jgi:hypothetical protein